MSIGRPVSFHDGRPVARQAARLIGVALKELGIGRGHCSGLRSAQATTWVFAHGGQPGSLDSSRCALHVCAFACVPKLHACAPQGGRGRLHGMASIATAPSPPASGAFGHAGAPFGVLRDAESMSTARIRWLHPRCVFQTPVVSRFCGLGDGACGEFGSNGLTTELPI